MTNISFSTGTYKEYTLNGTETIRVNVSDPGMIDRLKNCGAKCDELSKKYENITEDNLGEMDREIRALVDDALGCPGACDKAFGTTSCLAIANGKPIVVGFLEALLPQLQKDITAVLEANSVNNNLKSLENERTQKYLKPITVTPTVPASSTINVAALSQPERERLMRELLGAEE